MEIVKWGIVVMGILLLRKAAWGRISRRMQYGIWIVTVLLFMVQPFIPVQSSFSIENLFSESIIFREQNGTSMNTGITDIAPIKADSEAQDTALMGQDREETQVPLQGERTETDTILQSTAPFCINGFILMEVPSAGVHHCCWDWECFCPICGFTDIAGENESFIKEIRIPVCKYMC